MALIALCTLNVCRMSAIMSHCAFDHYIILVKYFIDQIRQWLEILIRPNKCQLEVMTTMDCFHHSSVTTKGCFQVLHCNGSLRIRATTNYTLDPWSYFRGVKKECDVNGAFCINPLTLSL